MDDADEELLANVADTTDVADDDEPVDTFADSAGAEDMSLNTVGVDAVDEWTAQALAAIGLDQLLKWKVGYLLF